MVELKKKPDIRFAGFTDAWEQHEVGELLIERNTQSPKSDEYPLMAFIAYEGVAPKGNRYNREFLVNHEANKKYKQTEFGDFIYSSNNLTTGSIGLNNYGKASISPVYSIFQPSELADSDFIGRLLVRKSFINQMVRCRQGVIYGQWRIHESDFEIIEIKAPSLAEQKQIGIFFKRLDNLITLHQSEYDKTNNIKKAMLEKMFPKDGADRPDIRFAGFTDAWEQRTFESFFERIPNNTLSRAMLNYTNGEIKSVHYGDILIKYGAVTNCKTDVIPFITDGRVTDYKRLLLRDGDVLIADAAEDEAVGKATELAGISDDYVVSGLHTIACRPKVKTQPNYLGYYMNSPAYHQQLLPLMQGIKVLSISRSNLSKTMILCPNSKQEQLLIGEVFTDLDNLITLHQREFTKLKSIKKALLEKMFI
ncbi:restriction endonuclease subunit S [Chloroflexota bacterium]